MRADTQVRHHHGALPDRLRAWRERAGLTQRELAAEAGLSVAAVRDLEQGRTRSSRPSSIRALAAALALSPAEAAELHQSAHQPRPQPPALGPNSPVRVAILGPLVAGAEGGPDQVGGGRHRIVLARLALTPAVAVSRDELVDLLWGSDIPNSAANLLQSYVSRLRRLLEPETVGRGTKGVLTFGPGGYRLNLDAHRLDLLAYRELVSGIDSEPEDPEDSLTRLDQALDLWRDEILSDVPELRGDPTVIAMTGNRVDTMVQFAQLAIQASVPDRVLPRLRELAARHPLHEPLQASLITVLGACGQRAAALATYQEIRRRLAEDLGIDPGPDLTAAQQAVLRSGPDGIAVHSKAEPPAPAVSAVRLADGEPFARPYQTPAPPPDFTGRLEPLATVRNILDRDPGGPVPSAVTVCVVSGTAGVGKTSLALRAAQQLSAAFPDGQLFVDLHGPGLPPAVPVDVMVGFLRALGVAGRRVPRDEAECSALYRSVLADRRMLVVLDNARSAAQVRPLIPGVGGNAVLITSRSRLVDLAGAAVVELGLPSAAEAVDMLTAAAGRARTADDPAAARDLVTACGLLPIAVRVAGARLASRPSWSTRTAVHRLADERHRLDQLRVGDIAVDACFEVSYRELSPSAARVFRLLALAPGGDFGLAVAAALTGVDVGGLANDLDDLVDNNLLQTTADGRYRYHDLLRLYAKRRVEAEDPPEARAEAVERLLDWYLDAVTAAMRLVYPEMVRLPVRTPGRVGFDTVKAARSWLDTEVTGMVTVIEQIAAGAEPERAWQLADQLRGYFFIRRDVVPWLASGRAGLAAAEQAGDRQAQAAMHQTIGQAHWSIGEHDLALAAYERAADLARQSRWSVGLAYQWRSIGLVQAEMGRLDEAEVAYRRALEISDGPQFNHVRAVALNDLGMLCHERGFLVEAADHFAAALRINQGDSHRPSAMANHGNLGMVLRQLGRFDQARHHLETALDYHRQVGSLNGELAILDELSQLHAQCDEPAEAVAAARQALKISREIKDRRSETAVLSTLGTVLIGAGILDEAEQCLWHSLQMAVRHAYPYFEVQARTGLARVFRARLLVSEALTEGATARGLARRVGYRNLEADALLGLAEACHAIGWDAEAFAHCRDAIEIYRASGFVAAERQATRLLDRLTASGPGKCHGRVARRSASSSGGALTR